MEKVNKKELNELMEKLMNLSDKEICKLLDIAGDKRLEGVDETNIKRFLGTMYWFYCDK